MAAQGSRVSEYPMEDMKVAWDRVRLAAQALFDAMGAEVTDADLTNPACVGMFTAEEVRSPRGVPPFACSRVDGYAIRSNDAGCAQLRVIATLRAEDASAIDLEPGCAAWVCTGGRLPINADAVVPVERSRECSAGAVPGTEKHVRIEGGAIPGENVRPAGSDWREGDLVIPANCQLTHTRIASLFSAGIVRVRVRRALVVGVLSTGNELATVDQTSEAAGVTHGVLDSNRPMLRGMLQSAGFRVEDRGVVRDVLSHVMAAIPDAARTCDVLVTTGGVSMGDHDFVKPALESLGEVLFGRLNMKPGKPSTCARVCVPGRAWPTLVFALPGNPVSAWVGMHMIVLPALRHASGQAWARCLPPRVSLQLMDTVTPDAERPEFHRCIAWYDAEAACVRARSTGSQASSRLASTLDANALAWLPAGSTAISSARRLDAYLVGPLENAEALSLEFREGPSDTVSSSCACGARAALSGPAEQHPSLVHAAPVAIAETATFRCGIVTVSDSVASGTAIDKSGSALATALRTHAALKSVAIDVAAQLCSPDDEDRIRSLVQSCIDAGCHVVITTGGTGFSPRDVTPEALRSLIARPAPGLVHCMFQAGLRNTPMAVLARYEAGMTADGSCLIIELPGSPKAVVECVDALAPLLPHVLRLMQSPRGK